MVYIHHTHPCFDYIYNVADPNRELVKIVDLLGRETELKANKLLIYYNDGSSEKVFKAIP